MYQLLNDGNIPFVSDMSDFAEIDNAIGRRLDREKILPPKYEDGELWKVLQKACEFEKKDRYQEARKFRKALKKLKNEIRVERKQKHGIEKSVKEEKQKLLEQVKKKETGLNIGESVWFGTYPQKADVTKQPIEWIILKKEKNKALLLSKYILEAKPYNEEEKNITWELSDIRSWLNNVFYEVAFNNMEKERIATTLVKTKNNLEYGTSGGNDTKDKIFLLSIEEVKCFLENNEERIAKVTGYAKKTGIYLSKEKERSWWWLRSPGKYSNDATRVSS